MLLLYVHLIFRNSGGDAVLSMWDDIDVSATAPHGSLTISSSNPTTMVAMTNFREQERKTSAPVVTPPVLSKKNFLDGFKMRGNLNPRTKSDDNVSDTTCVLTTPTTTTSDSDRISSQFRNTSTLLDASAAAAAADAIVEGSVTKVLVDYRPVNDDEVVVDRGDAVQVREVTPHGRYLVVTPSGREGWVPGYVLNLLTTSPSKKPVTTGSWTFKSRFKKQQSSGTLKEDSRPAVPAVDATCTVNCGDTAALRCGRMTFSVTGVSGGSGVRWMAPNGHILINSGRKYSFGADADTVVLYISDCDVRDSGEYTCVQLDNVESTVTLHVKDTASGGPPPLPEPPRVVDLRETTAILAWEHAACSSYTVECCRITDPNKSWTVVNRNVADAMCVVQDLTPGETYCFRVLADRCSEPSLPSNPLTVPPLSEVIAVTVNNPLLKRNSFQDLDDCWQRDFERQYIELEELGRGRYAVVRRYEMEWAYM